VSAPASAATASSKKEMLFMMVLADISAEEKSGPSSQTVPDSMWSSGLLE